jgi:hypothetical protein
MLFGSLDENGWALVERPNKKPTEQSTGQDSSLGVVFAKRFDSERALIRFPVEPAYRYPNLEQGDQKTIEVDASASGILYRLRVQESSLSIQEEVENKLDALRSQKDFLLISLESQGERSMDLLYQAEGKWVRERQISTGSRLYVLQTLHDTLNESFHLNFVDSFDLEIRGENKFFHREIVSKK